MQIRETVKAVNEGNKEYLRVIEVAAFVVCLDDASPNNATERARHFHFGDSYSRLNDKYVQFVVCKNGISGFIGDHSMLDVGTISGLNTAILEAILEHEPIKQDQWIS